MVLAHSTIVEKRQVAHIELVVVHKLAADTAQVVEGLLVLQGVVVAQHNMGQQIARKQAIVVLLVVERKRSIAVL